METRNPYEDIDGMREGESGLDYLRRVNDVIEADLATAKFVPNRREKRARGSRSGFYRMPKRAASLKPWKAQWLADFRRRQREAR